MLPSGFESGMRELFQAIFWVIVVVAAIPLLQKRAVKEFGLLILGVFVVYMLIFQFETVSNWFANIGNRLFG